MRSHLSRALLALLALHVTGCGSSRSRGDGGEGLGDGGGPNGALTVTPADSSLTVDGVNPATLVFTVMRGGVDVTAQATLSTDASFGSFSGATFSSTSGAAGKGTIRALLGGDSGSTTLTLKVATVVIAPGAPADAPTKFGGPDDPTRAPETVYPPDGALMPPNLSELEVHWRPAQATLFEIALSGDALDLRIYTLCPPAGTGCALLPDEKTWNLLAQAARGASVKLTLRGTSPGGGGVGKSATRTLSFADEDMKGGLYYWAAASGGIYRYDFGLRNQKPESFYTPQQAGGVQCVGCHALSRDGARITVGLNAPTPSAQMRALDVASRKTLFDIAAGFMGGSNFEALSSDASRLVTVENGGLTVRDAKAGTVLSATPAIANADMPDLSPDGKLVVFARAANGCMFGFCSTLSVMDGSLFTAPFTGTGFGGEKLLVQGGGGKNNYYPAFSPDGDFVAFNRAGGDSYNAMDARLMIVSATGGTPVDIASASAAQASWPKWAPFIHHYRGATILWLSFSSPRTYGVRQPMASQLWFVPVDVAKLKAGTDPGFPPLWLPFQDVATGNHIAQWVEKVERAPCSQIDQSGCMPNEQCVNGMCVPNPS